MADDDKETPPVVEEVNAPPQSRRTWIAHIVSYAAGIGGVLLWLTTQGDNIEKLWNRIAVHTRGEAPQIVVSDVRQTLPPQIPLPPGYKQYNLEVPLTTEAIVEKKTNGSVEDCSGQIRNEKGDLDILARSSFPVILDKGKEPEYHFTLESGTVKRPFGFLFLVRVGNLPLVASFRLLCAEGRAVSNWAPIKLIGWPS